MEEDRESESFGDEDGLGRRTQRSAMDFSARDCSAVAEDACRAAAKGTPLICGGNIK